METKIDELLDKVSGHVKDLASTKTVLGDEFTLGDFIIRPVIKVGTGFGRGAGTGTDPKKKASGTGTGAAAGLALPSGVSFLMVFQGLPRELIARRASLEIQDGEYVNLGIGIPSHLSNWLAGREVIVHSEVGMLNVGPLSHGDDCDLFGLTPGCEPVTELPGTAYFDVVESFGMVRAGYLDVSVMGAYQVDARGSFAG